MVFTVDERDDRHARIVVASAKGGSLAAECRGVVKRLLPTLLTAALLAASVAVAAAPRPAPPDVEASAATGSLKLTSSRGGKAIFKAGAVAPGRAVGGRVRIRNSRKGSASIYLSQRRVADRPGPGGGRLSPRLLLRVDDLTRRRVVYAGALRGLRRKRIGKFRARESRRFRFTVTVPAALDNSYQGSSVTTNYRWQAR
jgi:hypothetical protein